MVINHEYWPQLICHPIKISNEATDESRSEIQLTARIGSWQDDRQFIRTPGRTMVVQEKPSNQKKNTLSLPRCIYTSPAYQHQLHQLHQLHQYQAFWLTSTPTQIFNHRYTPSTVYVQVTDQPEKVEDQKICAHHDEPKDVVLRVRMPGQQPTFGSDFWRTKWIDAVRI